MKGAELDQLLPTGKKWLVEQGYVTRSTYCLEIEYQWTEKGLRWLNSLKESRNAVQSRVPMQEK